MKALIFLDYFTPAYKAGGPIRIFESLAAETGENTSLGIVTQNVDWGDPSPLNVDEGTWTNFKKAKVLYLERRKRGIFATLKIVRDFNPDVVHVNSLFSRTWTLKVLLLRRLGLLRYPVLLSPHGELAPSALAIKPGRKRVFLAIAKALSLFKGVVWLATSVKEQEEITAQVGPAAQMKLHVPSFPEVTVRPATEKRVGHLRLIALARLSAMKNLTLLLDILPKVSGTIDFDIYGPMDPAYAEIWKEAMNRFVSISEKIRVKHHGSIPSNATADVLSSSHLFVQPSLSENFGFSIVEALAAGTPVLISDRTPWNDVTSARVGFALPLNDVDPWIHALQSFIDMEQWEWQTWSRRSSDWVREKKRAMEPLLKIYQSSSRSHDLSDSAGDRSHRSKVDAKSADGK